MSKDALDFKVVACMNDKCTVFTRNPKDVKKFLDKDYEDCCITDDEGNCSSCGRDLLVVGQFSYNPKSQPK